MIISNEDLQRFVGQNLRLSSGHRAEGVLILPSNVVLEDSQKEWLKNNGVSKIEQGDRVVEL